MRIRSTPSLMRIAAAALGGSVFALMCACGKSSTEPSAPPVATNIITITASGVSPKTIVVAVGSQVTFVNNDLLHTHDMQSDPHPEHNDCPELALVGFLKPGESRQSGNLNLARTCGYHDNENEGNALLHGSIIIQ